MNRKDLIGKWKINRMVIHPDGFPKGRMRGAGQFDPQEGNQLLYQEQLWHETENKDLFFARKFYRYHFLDTSIDIYFYQEESNRLFMTLNKAERKGCATCQSDRYSLLWDWVSRNHFLMRYQTIGPKKNYMIKSEFLR
ncbi:MAG: DUF6314 family protein [Simkaniaceae bacterium]|nr:DUF6314 family protein [Simkaniaceae bacterium]